MQRNRSRSERSQTASRITGGPPRWQAGLFVGLAVLMASMLPVSVRAGEGGLQPNEWLRPVDWRHGLRGQEIGGRGHEFGAARVRDDSEPSDTGRRVKAGVLSLVVPGAGQFYNDQRGKGLVMVGVEAAIWGAYLGFHRHAGTLSDDYRNWAGIYADARGDHPDSYWQAVGRFLDSDAWYESALRQARAFGEPPPPPPPASQEWQWRSNTYRIQYQDLRADANRAYDRRDKMILFALLNRAVSVFDAVRHGGQPSGAPAGATGGTVLGVDLAVQIDPDWRHPAARAMAGWSF